MKRKLLALLLACIMTVSLLPIGSAFAMQVFIAVLVDDGNGETVTLEVEPSDSIDAVKAKIQSKKGLDPARQRLVYQGTILEDGHTLADYNVQKDSTILLRYRPENHPDLPFVVVRIKPGTATGSDLLVTSYDAGSLAFDYSGFSNGRFLWFYKKLAYKYPDVPQSFQSEYAFLRWRVEISGGSEAYVYPPGQGLSSMIEGETVTLTALWNDDPSSCTVQSPTAITVSENAQETSFTLSLSALHLGIADCAAFHFESGDFVSGENRIHYDTEHGNKYYFSTVDKTATVKLFIGEDTWQSAKGGYYTADLAYTIMYEDSYHVAITEETGTIPMTLSVGHSVTVTTNNDNGTVSASTIRARQGETVTLTASPFPGYRLKEWVVRQGGVTIENNAFVMGESDVLIEAVFEAVGGVTFKNWDGTVLQYDSFMYGEMPVYRGETPQKPSDDPHVVYTFIGWDPEIHAVSENSITYTAQFRADRKCIVTFDANGGGGAMGSDWFLADPGVYTLPPCGFIAPEGYTFHRWIVSWDNDDGSTSTGSYMANAVLRGMTHDITVQPEWKPIQITLQVSPNRNAGTAEFDPSASTFTATANEGYTFDHWEYKESEYSPVPAGTVWPTDNPYTPEELKDGIYTAVFTRKPYTVTVNANNNAWGSVSGSGTYLYGRTVTLTATPAEGCGFVRWETDPAGIEIADNMFTLPASDVTVTAVFIADGYYLIGQNGWTVDDIDPAQVFTVNPANENEYMLKTTLQPNDQFKVVRVAGGAIAQWHPDAADNYGQNNNDNNHVITSAGTYTIFFRPDGQGGDDWYAHTLYVRLEEKIPAFVSQDLLLSGEIGVQFFVDLSMLNETDKAAAYVTFAISGKGKDSIDKSEFHPDEERKNSKGYYGFICKVNAVQMADTITATLHYGDNQTIEKTYSVKEYVVKWDDTTANHPELLAHLDDQDIERYTRIIHALADYGHYVQPFLASINNFSIGNGEDQYAEMDKVYATEYDVDAIKAAASARYQLSVVRTGEADTFSDPTMSLVLDSETAIRVYFKAVGDLTFTVDGNAVDSVPASNGRRMVEIKGVKFGDLGVAHTIVATCGDDTMTVTVSALSYVAPFLTAFHGNAAAENAICALFMLSPAADDN